MKDLIRLFYTSDAVGRGAESISQIMSKSIANNAAAGITGILMHHRGQYIQVLEGAREKVEALFERLRSDPRHRNIRLYRNDVIETRMFDGWAMANPSLSDEQVTLTLALLTSDVPSSQETGLTYLKYWLSTQALESDDTADVEIYEKIPLSELSAGKSRLSGFSMVAFCFVILVAVIIDALFYFSEWRQGLPGSLEMLHAHGVAAIGLSLAIVVSRRGDLVRGVRIFQATALTGVALHMLHARYGIFAPALPYLSLAILANIIGNRRDKNHKVLLLCLALLIAGAALSFGMFPDSVQALNVPLHHAVIAGLLFPLVCALILDAQLHGMDVNQQFTVRVLRDLSLTIDHLKKAMAARNYFFSAISHEIRTPMAGAIAAVSLLKHPNAGPEVKARSLNSLDYTLTNLNRLLNDLLDVSKLESGHFQLAHQAFDINRATQSVLDFFQPGISEAGNTLYVYLPSHTTMVVGDSLRFQQMLANLLGNAVKFTKGGSITVRLTQETETSESLPCAWRCEVSDTGVGIPQKEIPMLFQPFSQASQHGYSETKGTGLGLAIVASLAKQMGGAAGVQSAEGQGSTFWFTFRMPLQAPAEKDSVADASIGPAGEYRAA